jgi:hypothetical protein
MSDLMSRNFDLVNNINATIGQLEMMKADRDKYHEWYNKSADKNLELVAELQKCHDTIIQLDKIISIVMKSEVMMRSDGLDKLVSMRNKIMSKIGVTEQQVIIILKILIKYIDSCS